MTIEQQLAVVLLLKLVQEGAGLEKKAVDFSHRIHDRHPQRSVINLEPLCDQQVHLAPELDMPFSMPSSPFCGEPVKLGHDIC